jgi:AcrR family transcriptional regulator
MRKGDRRRQQILDAAVRVFSEHGYEKASISRICEAVGVARGTLYQYFRDKQSVFQALVETQTQQIQAFAQPVDWERPDCPPPEQVLYERHLLIFELIQEHQDVFRLMMREARARNPETEDRVRKTQRALVRAMAAEIEAGVRTGHYRCPDPEFTAAYLFGGIVETLEWNLFISEQPAEPRELARKVTDLQLRVLLRPGAEEAR